MPQLPEDLQAALKNSAGCTMAPEEWIATPLTSTSLEVVYSCQVLTRTVRVRVETIVGRLSR